jgi:hypothetical protein
LGYLCNDNTPGEEFGRTKAKRHPIRLGFYSLNLTNHRNFNAVYNNIASPAFGQFAGFLDRREGAGKPRTGLAQALSPSFSADLSELPQNDAVPQVCS